MKSFLSICSIALLVGLSSVAFGSPQESESDHVPTDSDHTKIISVHGVLDVIDNDARSITITSDPIMEAGLEAKTWTKDVPAEVDLTSFEEGARVIVGFLPGPGPSLYVVGMTPEPEPYLAELAEKKATYAAEMEAKERMKK